MRPPFTVQIKGTQTWQSLDTRATLRRAKDDIRDLQRVRNVAKKVQSDITHPDVWVRVLDADRKEVVKAHRLS